MSNPKLRVKLFSAIRVEVNVLFKLTQVAYGLANRYVLLSSEFFQPQISSKIWNQ